MASADTLGGAVRSSSAEGSPVLAISGLRKEYGPVVALADGNLELHAGEIHALVGENGSGKSTLVGMVAGTVVPTAGSVYISGRELTKSVPAASQQLGSVTVFQDGSMLPEFTVAQNIYIGTRKDLRPSYGKVVPWAREVLAAAGITGIDPSARTRDVAPGDRQLIEIARAMYAKPDLLMLDEATSALDAAGVDRVMDLIEVAARNGSAVLFVTHRLGEVFRVAQNISVLRDGEWQGTMPASSVTTGELVNLMAGTTVDLEFPERPGVADTAPVVLSAEELTAAGVRGVSLSVRAGEIVGIAGADGNGQGPLLEALGAVTPFTGDLRVSGHPVTSPSSAVSEGVVYLSGDRKKESLFQSLSITENLNVAILKQLRKWGILSKSAETAHVNEAIDEFGIRVGDPANPVSSLSGGNQQKVAISRALSPDPRVLLIQEPTQGVDVRSRMDIYRMLRDAASEGLAVVVVSSDAAELAGICDRILVMSRGHIIHEMQGEGSSEDQIVGAFAVAGHAADPQALATEGEEVLAVETVRGLRRRFSGAQDLMRMGALALILLLLFLFASSQEATFASASNINNILLLAVPITVVAVAEFMVLIIAGIDISVGATVSLSIVAISFLGGDWPLVPYLLVALVVSLLVGLLVGVTNAGLVEGAKITPVIATIATLGMVGGLALILRPTAGGLISFDLYDLLLLQVGPIPAIMFIIVPLLLVGDWMIWKTGIGARLRAVGLHAPFAQRLGISVVRTRVFAYIACGMLAGLGGLVHGATVGTGDPTAGNTFLLVAIAAPVLGGASLMGCRGSMFGCLLGALTLAMANTLVPILGINEAWTYMIVGILTVIALLAYSSSKDGVNSVRSLMRRVRASE